MAFGEVHILLTRIGEFGIVYKAFYKRYINSETEVVAVKTLKGDAMLLPSCEACNYNVIACFRFVYW